MYLQIKWNQYGSESVRVEVGVNFMQWGRYENENKFELISNPGNFKLGTTEENILKILRNLNLLNWRFFIHVHANTKNILFIF